MIKAILFDLDGVLVNSKLLHFETFRDALLSIHPDKHLSWEEHEREFDGLSTKLKIQKLIQMNWISEEEGNQLYEKKQVLTQQRLPDTVKPRKSLEIMLRSLKEKGFALACCSNSIRKTVITTLRLLGVLDIFDAVYSNEDVSKPKPDSEIYVTAIRQFTLQTSNCLILEDSKIGRTAAHMSGAFVLEVEDAEDVTLELIEQTILSIQTNKYVKSRLTLKNKQTTFHIVIPMAGEGSRFREVGYKTPKPFIQIQNKAMVRWVIENMIPKEFSPNSYFLKFHLIVRSIHLENHTIDSLFIGLPKNISYTYHETDGLTEGAACSVLLAEEEINNEEPLIIVNSDQFIQWKPESFYKCLTNPTYSGNILCFYQPDQNDLKWSYADINNENLVREVKEKVWISPFATVGLYGWSRGCDFVKYAKQMIQKNIRVKNEFYVCPVYNEAIEDNLAIRIQLCNKMWGLGVPEDLETFFKNYLNKEWSNDIMK
jgi:HAD superfamily hydrolase (TIGR01509 family)